MDKERRFVIKRCRETHAEEVVEGAGNKPSKCCTPRGR